MTSDFIQVGVIGYGLSAKVFQIPFIKASAGLRLRAIVSRSGDQAAKDHPEAIIYREANSLFADTKIDLVVVATPPATHFDLVSSALRAEKHVVVEKPFAPSSEECNRLIELAKTKDRTLAVFQNRRWDADYVTLQKILEEDRLGRVVEFESHFDRYSPDVHSARAAIEAPGSGVVYDLGTHLIDQVLNSFGLPESITGFLNAQKAEDARGPHDACNVLLHYKSGLLATVKASALSAEEAQLRFWVRGDKGSFRKYHLDPQEPQLASGLQVSDPQFGKEEIGKEGLLTTVLETGYMQKHVHPNVDPPKYTTFYDRLTDALRGKGSVPVTGEEGRNVIRIVELAKESSEKGQTIALNPEEFK